MKISITFLGSDSSRKDSAYVSLIKKINLYNSLIDVDKQDNLESLKDLIVNHGCVYRKIVVINLYEGNEASIFRSTASNLEEISNALANEQSISIFDKSGSLAFPEYVSDLCVSKSNVDFIEIPALKPSIIVAKLFGVTKVDTSSAKNEIHDVIRKEIEYNESVPELIEDDTVPEELVDDAPEEIEEIPEEVVSPVKKSGFFSKFGKKNKSKEQPQEIVESVDESEAIEEASIDLDESSNYYENDEIPGIDDSPDDDEFELDEFDEPVDVRPNKSSSNMTNNVVDDIEDVIDAIDSSLDVVDEVVSKPVKESNTKKEKIFKKPSFFSKFGKSKQEKDLVDDEDIGEEILQDKYSDTVDDFDDSVDESLNPSDMNFDDIFMGDDEEDGELPPNPSKKKMAPEEAIITNPTGSGFFKNKSSAKKAKATANKYNKEQISMANGSPKIIIVTGDGRRGVSTLAASLGFVGAERMCNTLIVDMDFIKRTQSCIFENTENEYSPSLTSGISGAINAPHILPQFTFEAFTRLSTLGVDITCDYYRRCYEETTGDQLRTILTTAISNYNLIIVDIPWEYLRTHAQVAYAAHSIVYVSSNDLSTILSDANVLDEDSFDISADFKLIMSKMCFVLNMVCPENNFNGHVITKKNFTDVLYKLTDEPEWKYYQVLAEIPLISNVGNQVSARRPAAAFSDEMHNHCVEILYRLSDRK